TRAAESAWLKAFISRRTALINSSPAWSAAIARGANYERQRQNGNFDFDQSIVTDATANVVFPGKGYSSRGYQACVIAADGSVSRSAGAIPIQTRAEHAGAMDNADAFSAARAVLEQGGVMAIFPEGKTHGSLRIEPLKTGAARIALGTNLASSSTGLRIVPV